LAGIVGSLETLLLLKFSEVVLADRAPTLLLEVLVKLLVIVLRAGLESQPCLESGQSVLGRKLGLASRGTLIVSLISEGLLAAESLTSEGGLVGVSLVSEGLVLAEFMESVLADRAPSLSGEMLFKLLVIVALSSKSVPFAVSAHSVVTSDVELAELAVELAFTDDAGRANGGGVLLINDNSFRDFFSDSLGGDDGLNELDLLSNVDGFSGHDLLLDGDVVSDFDLLSESLGFIGGDVFHSGNVFDDFDHLLNGDVFDNLDSLSD